MSGISFKAINHRFMLVFAAFFLVNAHHTKSGQAFDLTLTIDFSILRKDCYRLTHTSFHTV